MPSTEERELILWFWCRDVRFSLSSTRKVGNQKRRNQISVMFDVKIGIKDRVSRALQWRRANIPSDNTIRDTFNRFKESGSVHNCSKPGRPSLKIENVEISIFFQSEPKLSLLCVANKADSRFRTVQNVARRKLSLFPYKIRAKRSLRNRRIFSDEVTFYLNGIIMR